MAVVDDYSIRLLKQDDNVRRLSHGEVKFLPLRRFLEIDAKKHHASHVSKTYVFATSEALVKGYITIICSQIKLVGDEIPQDTQNYRFDFPAVKIAKLCVDVSLRANGVGKKLVNLAIAVARENVLPSVGCRFVIVDSHKDAIDFYSSCGFILVKSDTNKSAQDPLMFLDIGKLQ